MAFLCFTLLVQPISIMARQDSHSRDLLVELDDSPDMDPGSDITSEEPEMLEAEERPTDDFNSSLSDDDIVHLEDEDVAISANDEPGARIRNLNGNVVTGKEGGYRSSN